MKLPTTFLNRLLRNEAMQISLVVERDCQEIDSRFEHEGMSFLTITLPSLDKALVQGLTEGRLTPSMFNGFKPFKRGGMLPAFLSGFFRRVFDEDGSLLERPCIASIRAIRQVTCAFKKVKFPCSTARREAAFERYRSNDESISWDGSDPCGIRRIAGYLWSDLQRLSGELYCSPGTFGTGATAERVAFNQRHSIKQWPSRSEPWFPSSYHASHLEDDTETFNGIDYLRVEEEQPVRVVDVPKTLKTPRIISVEPSYMMLMQQSVAKPLMAYLESEQFQYNGSIRFTKQSVNQEMARVGSLDGSYATIDLKDASDLVGNNLVKHVFSSCPGFLELIQACRSTRALLPDKSVINLRKFASQGSALCFPIEAMVFFTIIIASIVRQSGRRPSKQRLAKAAANAFVYGDDIIVPAETATGVMEDLEAYGLVVNRDKSFTTGFFRESCGADWYNGVNVTPTYVRQWDLSGSIRDPRMLEAYISLSNQFYMKGLWNVSQYIRDHVDSTHGRLSRSTRPLGVCTWTSVIFDTGLRYSSELSGFRVKGPVLRVGQKSDPIKDIRAGMLLCFQHGFRRDYIANLLQKVHEEKFSQPNGDRIGDRAHIGDVLSSTFPVERDLPVEWVMLLNDTKHQGNLFEVPSGCLAGRKRPAGMQESFSRETGGLLGNGPGEHHSYWSDYLSGTKAAKDLTTSVDSYVSKVKRRWAPTKVGISTW